jgi:hypothetical protein
MPFGAGPPPVILNGLTCASARDDVSARLAARANNETITAGLRELRDMMLLQVRSDSYTTHRADQRQVGLELFTRQGPKSSQTDLSDVETFSDPGCNSSRLSYPLGGSLAMMH